LTAFPRSQSRDIISSGTEASLTSWHRHTRYELKAPLSGVKLPKKSKTEARALRIVAIFYFSASCKSCCMAEVPLTTIEITRSPSTARGIRRCGRDVQTAAVAPAQVDNGRLFGNYWQANSLWMRIKPQ
jgi:hypothetical protein